MSAQSDAEDFDACEARLVQLRQTPEWKAALKAIEARAAETVQSMRSVAVPILKAAGEAALPLAEKALADFAMSSFTAALEKWGSK